MSNANCFLYQWFIIQWLGWETTRFFSSNAKIEDAVSYWTLLELYISEHKYIQEMNYFILFYVCSNLSGNKFEGSVPEALLQKYRDGSLVLRLAYHPIHILFQHPPPPPHQKKKKDPIYCDCFLNMTKWLEEVFIHLLIRCCESDFKCIFKEKKKSVWKDHSSFNNLPLHWICKSWRKSKSLSVSSM